MHDKKLVNSLNRVIVALYKVLGFFILTVILVGLIAYLTLHGFYLTSRSWIAPTIISPSDEHILELNARSAAQAAAREKLIAERMQLRAELEDAKRTAAAEEEFQRRFAAALAGDRAFRARELDKLLALREQHRRTREEFEPASSAYAAMARSRAEALAGAHLIDREAYLTTSHQLAQIGNAGLILAEKGVDIDTRIAALRREIAAMDAIASGGKKGDVASSVDVLRLHQHLTVSELGLARARARIETIEESLRTLDDSIARYDHLLAAIKSSPYIKAIEGNLTVAFVPYDNIENVEAGESLYGCSLGLFWCTRVGSIARILDGEVTRKHPIRNLILRGAMVEIELGDPRWARKELLHIGGAPLLF